MANNFHGWEDEVAELRRREALAHRMGGAENIERQHDSGRLTVRERIEKLLDPGTFHERGALAGRATYEGIELVDFLPANFVMGTGRIEGRRVVVGGDDFTVRGGAGDASIVKKQVQAEQTARELRIPIVRLIDGTGGGGSVKMLDQMRRTYVPSIPGWEHCVAAMSEVPVVSAPLGPVAGLGAARAAAAHFSVMVKGVSQVFAAGPPIVHRALNERPDKEQLGGSHVHARNGTIDNEVASEEAAFDHIRAFLSYLPSSVWEPPPRRATDDRPDRCEEELLTVIPREKRRPHDARTLLRMIVDQDSFFEIGRLWGCSLITGLATLHGWPVGIVTNDPTHVGGTTSAAGAEKLARHVDLCDTFHLPVVNLVDNPGFMVGTEAEQASTIRRGVRAMSAVFQATVPWVSVIVRRAFGVAGASHGNSAGLNLRYAWPSADWGSLPLEGGIEAAYKRELAAADDPEALLADLQGQLNAIRSPLRTAERYDIEEMIDPRETRPILCDWVEQACWVAAQRLGPKARGLRP